MPRVTASSMADIAFLLLVFFLVCTTIQDDKGIKVLLPPYTDHTTPTVISERNLLRIMLGPAGQVRVDQRLVPVEALSEHVIEHVTNPLRKRTAASDPRKAVISLVTSRDASYSDYLAVYDQVLSAYQQMRNTQAFQDFGVAYMDLTTSQRSRVQDLIPLRISEAE